MPIPLLAAGAAKAAAAAKAAVATAATAVKAGAATAAKIGAATAAKTAAGAAKAVAGASKVGAGVAKGKLSLGMLQDPKVNLYPGSKVKAFAKKSGKYLENVGGQAKGIEFSKPTEARISPSGSEPNSSDSTYSKQIDKLESLQK